jgi:hypothetical protein
MIPVTPLVLADIYFYQDEDTTDTDGSKFNMSKNDVFKPLFVLFWPVHQDFSGSCSFENCFCNAQNVAIAIYTNVFLRPGMYKKKCNVVLCPKKFKTKGRPSMISFRFLCFSLQ